MHGLRRCATLPCTPILEKPQMPSNGTAVKLPHELDPPSTTEIEIGDAVAAAAVEIGRGCAEFAREGQLSAEILSRFPISFPIAVVCLVVTRAKYIYFSYRGV